METIKTETIEIELPQDILFVMRSADKPGEISKKMKPPRSKLRGIKNELNHINEASFGELNP
ncbi:MAG: hypothetical protein ACMUIS_06650 [bacterium]